MSKSGALGNILYVSRCNFTYKKSRAGEFEISAGESSLLAYVCRNPGCRQDSLMEELGYDKTRVTHIVTDLEEKGYIVRKVSEEDARRKHVFPTGKGLDIHEPIRECFAEFRERVFDGLSDEEVEELARLTSVVRKNAREIIKEIK